MCASTQNPSARSLIRAVQACYTGDKKQAVEDIARALALTKKAHMEWVEKHGEDEAWPLWYAKYLLGLDPTPEGHSHADDPQPARPAIDGYGVAPDDYTPVR